MGVTSLTVNYDCVSPCILYLTITSKDNILIILGKMHNMRWGFRAQVDSQFEKRPGDMSLQS